MLYFRACPHCRTGTVYIDWDADGTFLECMNCGWMLDVSRPAALERTWQGEAAEVLAPDEVVSAEVA